MAEQKKKAEMSAGELATYAAGSGLGGVGGYKLYKLLNDTRTKGGALLSALMGAGLGASGAQLLLNKSLDSETGVTFRDILRGSAGPKIQYAIDNRGPAQPVEPLPEEEQKEPLFTRFKNTVQEHPFATLVPAGTVGGAVAGVHSGNAAVRRAFTPASTGIPERWDTGVFRQAKGKPSLVIPLGQPTNGLKMEHAAPGPRTLRAIRGQHLLGGTAIGTGLGLATAGALSYLQYKREHPRQRRVF